MGTNSIEIPVVDEEVECVLYETIKKVIKLEERGEEFLLLSSASTSQPEPITVDEQPLDLRVKKFKKKVSPLKKGSPEIEIIFESVIKQAAVKEQRRTVDDVQIEPKPKTCVTRNKTRPMRTPKTKQGKLNLELVRKEKDGYKIKPQQAETNITSCTKPKRRQKLQEIAAAKTGNSRSVKGQQKFTQGKRAESKQAETISNPNSKSGFQNQPGSTAATSWSQQFDLNMKALNYRNGLLVSSEGGYPCGCGYPNCNKLFPFWKEWFLHMLCDHNCNTAFGGITCNRCTRPFKSVVEHSRHACHNP